MDENEGKNDMLQFIAATVEGWNAAPTPFEWGGTRWRRRQCARDRRHALGGSGACTRRAVARQRRPSVAGCVNGDDHEK